MYIRGKSYKQTVTKYQNMLILIHSKFITLHTGLTVCEKYEIFIWQYIEQHFSRHSWTILRYAMSCS